MRFEESAAQSNKFLISKVPGEKLRRDFSIQFGVAEGRNPVFKNRKHRKSNYYTETVKIMINYYVKKK